VRSSATAEELEQASFAGQQDTYLAVDGERAVLAAVEGCWPSLRSERAVAYRAANGIPEDGLAMGVVVQRMVDAEAAGVVFTTVHRATSSGPGRPTASRCSSRGRS
jgi:pyruvate,water dikinase